jgi:TolB-like protein/Tfp pilus assembly protein PilF
METPFQAYSGDEPYVFVCYAHEDGDIVYPEMVWLREQGTNLWYDEGISAGKNWRAAIGDSLLGARHVLFYISARSLKSDHCNREINLALDEGKDVVPIYLEAIELTSDLKVGLNRVQALHRDQDVSYQQHLLQALGLSTSTVEPQPGATLNPAAMNRPRTGWPTMATVEELRRERLPKSVAVLPFANISPDPDDAYFTTGIHDDILTQLAKISTIKVISRTSVMEYRDTTKNVREIGRELNVATILEGGVRRAGDSVRINVQLIDAEMDEHLWAETYDRQLTVQNIFAIQSEMASSIAEALEATLSPQETARLTELPTQNTRAYDFYLTGNSYLRRSDFRTFMPLSIQMYERAVEEDPGFALAFSRLSIAHGQMYWFGFDQTESRLKMAEEAVERALAVAPDLPAAHLALGYYYYRGFRNYDKALREFDVAEQATPPDSELFEARGYIYKRLGEWDRSLESTSRAIELDPRNANLFYQQASTYGIRRDYVSAEEHLERALEIAPDNVGAYTMKAQIPLRRDGNTVLLKAAAENPPIQIGIKRQWLGWYAAIYERNFDTALKYLDSWNIDVYEEQWECVPKSSFYGVTYNLAKRPELAEPKFRASRMQIEAKLKTDPNDPRLYIALGEVLAGTDESEAAIRAVHRAMNLLPTSTDAFDGPVYRLATIIRVLVPAGDHDGAIEELDAYLAEPGRWSIEGLLPDPRLDPIRDEPRFHVLVEKYKR